MRERERRERERKRERREGQREMMSLIMFTSSVQELVGEAEESGGLPWTLQEDERKT